jgi:hypothetical protein
MAKTQRVKKIKDLIETGYFKQLYEVFEIAAPTPVAKYLGSNPERFQQRLNKPQDFRLREIYLMATYFDVSEDKMLSLVHNQYLANKAKRKKA